MQVAEHLRRLFDHAALSDADIERERIHASFRALLATRTDAQLEHVVQYANTKGVQFGTAEEDIFLHVAMHAQYHRGRVNALLRRDGQEPAPVDYIGYVRSVATSA